MPPVAEITEKTAEDSRSNRRPTELIGSRPTSDPRSRIAGPQSSKCDAAASCPHSIFAKRLECCADQLSAPRKADIRSTSTFDPRQTLRLTLARCALVRTIGRDRLTSPKVQPHRVRWQSG
jgi:hypothetical protein